MADKKAKKPEAAPADAPKQKVNIDGNDYDLDTLSDGAKNQLVNLQLVDQKIAALQQDIAIMQTARNAYANALVGDLPFKSDKLPT
uniref:Uncharacterized protein n=1 Tax=OCS116 cluster bacterium TaxID=2030921 RepID=A0A2A4YQT5_9PROT